MNVEIIVMENGWMVRGAFGPHEARNVFNDHYVFTSFDEMMQHIRKMCVPTLMREAKP